MKGLYQYGGSKQNKQKKITSVRIKPGITYVLFWCLPDWANLTFDGKSETLGSLCSHVLLILA